MYRQGMTNPNSSSEKNLTSLNNAELEEPLLQQQNQPERVNLPDFLRKVLLPGFSLVLCFVVTLSLYPAVTSFVKSTTGGSRSDRILLGWLFLMFNLFDFLGRFSTGFFFWQSQYKVFAFSVVRFLLIPLFLCLNFKELNAEHDAVEGLIFPSDTVAVGLHILLGFSNGFLCSNASILGPKIMFHREDKNLAATVCLLSLSTGLFLGSWLSFPLTKAISATP